jgi:hypothetical protein
MHFLPFPPETIKPETIKHIYISKKLWVLVCATKREREMAGWVGVYNTFVMSFPTFPRQEAPPLAAIDKVGG